MRTALVLLLLLAIASIPGSIFPQRAQNPLQVTEYYKTNPNLAQWLDRLSLFNVYSSSWFSAIYILLFISLIGCVVPRTWEHFKSARALPPMTPKNLYRLEEFNEIRSTRSESELLQIAESTLRNRRYRIRSLPDSMGAEKGFIRETGNLLFHLSLILLLVGVAYGSLSGMRADVIVSEGETFTNVATSYDSLNTGGLFGIDDIPPFTITVQKFTAKYDLVTTAPQDYELRARVVDEPGKEGRDVIVKVNKPLTFGATRVYLQANGYSPIVTVKDKSGAVVLRGAIPFLPQDGNLTSIGSIKVPDMSPQLGFVAKFLPTAERSAERGGFSTFPEALKPLLDLAAWSGDLGLDSGIPQSVYRINTEGMDQIGLAALAPGQTWSLPGGVGSITFEGFTPWVNLQVVRDPGKPYSFVGAVLILLGLLVSLIGRRHRIWVRVSTKDGDTLVHIAGLTRSSGLDEEIKAIMKALSEVKL
jgi:cytochrome c biogenesis protein